MNPVAAQIVARFEEAGWRVETVGEIGDLDAVAVKPYAIAGIAVFPSSNALGDTWLEKQASLTKFRAASGINRLADAYLLMVVDEISDDLASVASSIASDTTVCRKLIVELRGRRAREALDDIPLLPLSVLHDQGQELRSTATHSDSVLPAEVLNRLAKEGADRILDHLLGAPLDESELE